MEPIEPDRHPLVPPPAPDAPQDDLTDDDHRVEATDNGLRDDDPPDDEQPPQDPGWLPEGTVSERARQ